MGGEGNAAWWHAAYNGAGDGGQGSGKWPGLQINAQPATGGQAFNAKRSTFKGDGKDESGEGRVGSANEIRGYKRTGTAEGWVSAIEKRLDR